jgi:TRAP-type C4-dicarboxylate transport system substrate-binding protein
MVYTYFIVFDEFKKTLILMTTTRRDFITKTTTLAGASLVATWFPAWVQAAIQFNPADEVLRRETAKYIMTFASPYPSEDWRVSPHMHQELKQNIQELTKGAVFVETLDKGRGGMADVARNKKAAALVSVSNLTPTAKELDILNIPFWLDDEQSYLNLITSKVFDELILQKIRAQGHLEPLFWYLPGFRTATSTKLSPRTIKVPSDIKDSVFRVPPSIMLKQLYTMAGAKARKIPWKHVTQASMDGAIQAMDPSVVGLYSGPNGLRNHLGVISKINSVYDGWIAVVSQEWMRQLDSVTRDQVKAAADKTFREHLIKRGSVNESCERLFNEQGVRTYTPTTDEKQQWYQQCGHSRPEWDRHKKNILGDIGLFDKLLDAAKHSNGYQVS